MEDRNTAAVRSSGAFAPLREPTFRSIWITSLFSNFGQLILGVGAAWEMTRLSTDATMVALVQTAMMLPLMLIAVPAGAIADMFDRRKTALIGLAFSTGSALLLTFLAYLNLTTPWMLLGFCALIGAGVALFGPAWQASIREQVQPADLPAAVALGSVSYNLARSVGPALGGLIVVAAGAKVAFGVTAVSYVPIFIAFLLWRRIHLPSRLPPERIDRAIMSGFQYARHSPPIRTVLIRAFLFGLASASYGSLAALIARDLLKGGADMFGLLLGASGIGAVAGALAISSVRERPGPEMAARLSTIATSIALVVMGFSHHAWLTSLCFFVTGGANILLIGLLNITVQLSAPRWVTARVLSLFTSALTGGVAGGAVLWGKAAANWGVDTAMVLSGGALFATLLIALLLPLRDRLTDDLEAVDLRRDPHVALDINLRSGPIIIEVDYQVDPALAREFYGVLLKLQHVRRRNGAFNWSLARDIADAAMWTERFECSTWGDYLRVLERQTQADLDAQIAAEAFNTLEHRRVRRRLERPFGSVRWRAESPDPRQANIPYIAP
jgi:MFS family permease